MSVPYAQEILIWIDLETTGLDPEKDQILEVGCVLTRADLTEIDRWSSPVRPSDPFVTNRFVAAMHAANGLWQAVGDTETSYDLHTADCLLSEFLQKHGIQPGKGLIAGSTPQFDKAFIARHMPQTIGAFNHRVFDVSTLKAAMRMWCTPTWGEAEGDPAHRALADIDGSIAIAKRFQAQIVSG